MALDSFVIERNHLQVKAIADKVLNTQRFERSVLGSLLNEMLHIGGDSTIHALLGRVVRVHPDVHSASKLRVHGLLIACGDIVMNGESAGSVTACLAVRGTLALAVSTLRPVGEHTQHWGCWQMDDATEVWIAAHVVQTVAWKAVGGASILILR